jgi:hypothetical protein
MMARFPCFMLRGAVTRNLTGPAAVALPLWSS